MSRIFSRVTSAPAKLVRTESSNSDTSLHDRYSLGSPSLNVPSQILKNELKILSQDCNHYPALRNLTDDMRSAIIERNIKINNFNGVLVNYREQFQNRRQLNYESVFQDKNIAAYSEMFNRMLANKMMIIDQKRMTKQGIALNKDQYVMYKFLTGLIASRVRSSQDVNTKIYYFFNQLRIKAKLASYIKSNYILPRNLSSHPIFDHLDAVENVSSTETESVRSSLLVDPPTRKDVPSDEECLARMDKILSETQEMRNLIFMDLKQESDIGSVKGSEIQKNESISRVDHDSEQKSEESESMRSPMSLEDFNKLDDYETFVRAETALKYAGKKMKLEFQAIEDLDQRFKQFVDQVYDFTQQKYGLKTLRVFKSENEAPDLKLESRKLSLFHYIRYFHLQYEYQGALRPIQKDLYLQQSRWFLLKENFKFENCSHYFREHFRSYDSKLVDESIHAYMSNSFKIPNSAQNLDGHVAEIMSEIEKYAVGLLAPE